MFFRKSIALKTFAFTLIIVTAVVFVSFGTLYLVMPSYYLKHKVRSFGANTKTLYDNLENEENIESITRMVQDFSRENAAEVYCFDKDENLLILLYNSTSNVSHGGLNFSDLGYMFFYGDYTEEPELEVVEEAEAETEKTSGTAGTITIGINEYEDTESGTYLSNEFKIFVYSEDENLSDSDENTAYIAVGEEVSDELILMYDTAISIVDEANWDGEPVKGESIEPAEISEIRKLSVISPRTLDTSNSSLNADLKFADHAVLSSVSIASNLQPIDEAKGVLISLIPYLLGLNMLIGIVCSYIYSRKFARPIIEISNAAMSMQSLESDIESGIRTKDELGNLSENLDLLYKKLLNNIHMLTNEMEKVRKLEKSKTDFMRAASHELKTPLAGLKGMLEGMSDGVGKYKDRDKYLQEAEKLTDKMTGLVYEILNATKLDSDLELDLESIDVTEILKDTADNYSMFIGEKNINIDFVMPDKPIVMETDRFILDTVLSNVFSNAVKYTEKGGRIQAGILLEKEKAILFIENTCDSRYIDMDKLFEPFYTGSYSRDRSQTGTGLGLYIVKKNLELLGLDYELLPTQTGLRFQIFLRA